MFAVGVTEDGHFWLERIEEIIRASGLPAVMGLDSADPRSSRQPCVLQAANTLWQQSDSVPSESDGSSSASTRSGECGFRCLGESRAFFANRGRPAQSSFP